MSESHPTDLDGLHMARALELAKRGQGYVEPNPMVGCVIAKAGKIVGEGWHQKFGGPHAEIEALAAAGEQARSAEAYVSLEPCCHQGKTGPCTAALINAGIARVVIGCRDPNPQVAGKGIEALVEAGIEVCESDCSEQAESLIAPFRKLVTTGRPWVIGKWAMTLDGKIATHTGSSKWISGECSRQLVHDWRGRVDAVIVGRGTVDADDPLLTARPPGPRIATRIVLDTDASLDASSQLLRTIDQAPVLVATGKNLSEKNKKRLEECGAEVLPCDGADAGGRLLNLFDELGRRQMTNVLVEGGAEVMGTLCDVGEIDEVRVFIAPKLAGGRNALTAVAGQGIAEMADALRLVDVTIESLDGDVLLSGRVQKAP